VNDFKRGVTRREVTILPSRYFMSKISIRPGVLATIKVAMMAMKTPGCTEEGEERRREGGNKIL
jgi:hypothetical protein